MSDTVWRWIEGVMLTGTGGVVAAAGWLIAKYYAHHETLNTHTREISELRDDVDGLTGDHAALRSSLIQMERTLSTVANDVSWIKEDLKARKNHG